MRDFERMKTSLPLTDVVVLRNTGDTVKFLNLEITKTSRSFEVRNSHELVDPLLSLYGLQNIETSCNSGTTSHSERARISHPIARSQLLHIPHRTW